MMELENSQEHSYQFLNLSNAYLTKNQTEDDVKPKEFTSYDEVSDDLRNQLKLWSKI